MAMKPVRYRTFVSRFGGRCASCKGAFSEGDTVVYDSACEETLHEDCHQKETPKRHDAQKRVRSAVRHWSADLDGDSGG